MEMELDYILPGRAVGSRKPDYERIIKDFTTSAKGRDGGAARRGKRSRQRLERGFGPRSADPHHRDRRRRSAGRQSV